MIGFLAAPHAANAEAVVVGANLTINSGQLPVQEQEKILAAMQAASVRNLRTGLRDSEESIDFAQRAYTHGIKIDWIALPIKTGAGPTPPEDMKDLWHEKALSSSDIHLYPNAKGVGASKAPQRGLRI